MDFRKELLTGKTALVIGASSESGPDICSTLAAYGANLAFTYNSDVSGADSLSESLLPTIAKSFKYDLFDRGAEISLLQKVLDEFGKIDLLVNLGGPPPIFTDFYHLTNDEFDVMINSHFRGYFFLALETAKKMAEGAGGIIINISATSSRKYDHVAYGLAKACTNEATKFLARAFAPKVRVYTIIPGLIEQPGTDLALAKKRAETVPLGRNVSPGNIGDLIVALTSSAFTCVTGESIIIDGGGWLLNW
jgi:NAD(P)-dependent dehydrogenase (short-subunit alcohol dehydrogenase family)